jgi:hypothetical protein
LFRTAKYRPEFSAKGFTDLAAGRARASGFVQWCNFEHGHSGIRYVRLEPRHKESIEDFLVARHQL